MIQQLHMEVVKRIEVATTAPHPDTQQLERLETIAQSLEQLILL